MLAYYNCSSANEGDAIYAANRNSNTLTINNEKGSIVFSNCEAGADGGAISVQEKTATINNKGAIVFDHCESGQDGGGICTDGYALNVNNSEDASILFDTCKALKKTSSTANGGGLCGVGNVTLRDGTQFSGCRTTSTTGRGTALYLATSGSTQNVATAHWNKLEWVTVAFDSDGGSACEPISVQKGTRIKSYPTPTKDGCVFAGWYTSDGVEVNDQTTIDEDVAVRAKWNEMATVTFNWTDRKDADGNPVVTTDTVEQGKTLSMIPGTYREGYVLDGWYPDAEFTGEALTASTVIDDDVTYYAKWRLSKIEKDEPVEYEFDVKWTDASTSELTNLNDCLTWYVAGSTSKTVEAHAYVGFALKETEGKVFQPGTIKIRVPKYVFVDWNGNSIRGTNDIVAYIPKAPAKSKTFRWNYVDEGDYYVIQNTEATENVTFDLRITYAADIKNVRAARISSQTGQHLDS